MLKHHLRTIAVLALTIPLIVWFLHGARLADVWDALRHARLSFLVLAVGTTMTVYIIRAARWLYLLRALGPAHYRTAFRTTVIGFAASSLLPARAGEVLRPYLLAKQEKLSATAAFATIILERLLDLVTVVVLFAIFLLTFNPAASGVDPALFGKVRMGGVVAGVVAVAGLILFFMLAGHPEALGRAALRIDRVLPARFAHALSLLVRKFAEGLGAIRQPGRLAITFLLSFPLWFAIASGIFLVTRAFHIEIPFNGALLVMSVLVIGVAMPTPGQVGGFEVAYRLAVTSFYSPLLTTGRDAALGTSTVISAALVLHAISFLPVTLLGIIFMAQEGLSLGRARSIAKGAGNENQRGEEIP